MSFLPQSTYLGKLEIIEVYVYYDQPCLFSCQNSTDQIFLAVWVDETEEFNLWLYVPMSRRRFEEVRMGGINLRDAFLKSESGFVYEVKILPENSPDAIATIPCEQLDEDWLPQAGTLLRSDSQTLPVVAK